jgi:hypothetical protein
MKLYENLFEILMTVTVKITVLWNVTPCSLVEIFQCFKKADSLRAGRSGYRIPVGARFSVSVQTGPGAYPASCTMGTGSFPGVKRPGRGVDHPPPSSAEVKERVELYLYSPSGPSWPVLGWTLPLTPDGSCRYDAVMRQRGIYGDNDDNSARWQLSLLSSQCVKRQHASVSTAASYFADNIYEAKCMNQQYIHYKF